MLEKYKSLVKKTLATVLLIVSWIVSWTALWIVPSASLAGNHHPAVVEFTAEKIAESIYFLAGGDGGNIAVLSGEDGLLIIDDGYKHRSAALQKTLEEIGGKGSLQYIVNTHWHGDHTEGNLALGSDADIVAHHNVRTRLQQSNEVKLFGMKSEPYPAHALPNLTYNSEMTLHFNGEEVQLLHEGTGHTDGDTVVFFKNANIVHMGDLFFNGFFTFVDVDNGGNVVAMANSIEVLLERIADDAVIVPGHGPVASKADLQHFLAMLRGTVKEVQAMRDAGLNMKQMQTKGLSDKWAEWTDGFLSTEAWVQIVAESLK